jgi:ketosteroid isomerase-like protein
MNTTATPTKSSSTSGNTNNGSGPTQSPTDQATLKVAQRLIELCKSGDGITAIQELYADNAKHIEAMEMPGCPRVTEGKSALIEKSQKFAKTTTVHSKFCTDPLVNGEQFTCNMSMDVTSNEGPMAGKRMQMNETALYTVKNGKIAEGKFFYGMPGKN